MLPSLTVVRPSVAAVLVAGIVACGPDRPPDPVVLALGEQQARRSEFDAYVASVEARGQEPLTAEVRAALLEAWIERRLLVMEARARGLVGPLAAPDEEAAAVQKLLSEEVNAKVTVGEGEIESYYREHAADLAQPETVTVRQILVATSNEARDVRRRLQKDPRIFSVLAQTLSRGPEAGAGGLMGTFARGQLPPELEAAVFSLRAGATSAIVQTPLGYHVLRVESRSQRREASLEDSRERIRTLLGRRKSERGVREFVAGLLVRAKVNHEAAKTRLSR